MLDSYRQSLFLVLIVLIPVRFSGAEIEEVFLLPFSHCDLGFTDPLDTVALKYKDNIDEAIAMCEENEDFYWTIESLWQLEQWLLRSSDREIEQLRSLVLKGRMEVGALYGTFRSGLLGLEDANRLLYPMRHIQQKLDIPFYTAIQNDTPGYSSVYPRLLASDGISYFLTGVNLGFGGGTTIPRKANPFYWHSADGGRVLTWIDYDSYISVGIWGLHRIFGGEENPFEVKKTSFIENLIDLESSGYPHRTFMLMAALGDNKEPGTLWPVVKFVRQWNSKGLKPRLRFGTPKQFFEALMKEPERSAPPDYWGHWHGLWDARVWNPAGNTLARWGQRNLPSAELLASLMTLYDGAPYYDYDLQEGYRALACHVEHTCGGDPGWLIPYAEAEVRRQNVLTLRFAQDARYAAERVIRENLVKLSGRVNLTGPAIVVFNPLPWPRDARTECILPRDLLGKQFDLLDTDGKGIVPYRLNRENSALAFTAPGVPACGYQVFPVALSDGQSPPASIPLGDAASFEKTVIENRYYRVAIEGESGVIQSIWDKETGRELVDSSSPYPWGALCVVGHDQTWSENQGKLLRFPCRTRASTDSLGHRAIIERDGSLWPRTEIELPYTGKYIRITQILDRRQMPDVPIEKHSDHYHFVFPLALNSEKFEVKVDGPDGIFNYPEDYLPGATLGAVQSQFGIHLQEEAFGVTIAHRQSFNWTVGSVNRHRKDTDLDGVPPTRFTALGWMPPGGWGSPLRPYRPWLFSAAVQYMTQGTTADIEVTHFDETEPGADPLMVFDYYLTTGIGPFQASAMTRFCRDRVVEAPALYRGRANSGKALWQESEKGFGTVQPPNVLLTAFKKAEFGPEGAYAIRVKELDGLEAEVTYRFPIPVKRAMLATLTEQPLPGATPLPVEPVRFTIGPHAVQTVLLEFVEPED